MQILFILVEPAVPENIGSAARALKTMGFDQMRLVNPVDPLSGPARWLAHGAADILEKAEIFSSLGNAVQDIDLLIGTSAKPRRVKNDYHTLASLPRILREKGDTLKKTGILFGREDSGLRNEELRMCDLMSTIPLKTSFPSLNLAQAVMVYAYQLSEFTGLAREKTSSTTSVPFSPLKEKVSNILLDLGFEKNSAIYPRIMERLMLLKEGDMHLLHSVCNQYNKTKK
jgi:tRNA/rRNA methyltransferase